LRKCPRNRIFNYFVFILLSIFGSLCKGSSVNKKPIKGFSQISIETFENRLQVENTVPFS